MRLRPTGLLPPLLFLLLLLSAWGASARSQPDPTVEADQHFQAGDRLSDQGDFARALEEYRRAYQLSPHPRPLFNIAKMYELQGKLPEAHHWYQRYLDESADGRDIEAYRRRAETRLHALESTPAKINVACELQDATRGDHALVLITAEDGSVRRAGCGEEVTVRAGRYRIDIRADHYDAPKTQEVTLRIGQPYNYFAALARKKGVVRIFADPDDALVLVDQKVRISGAGDPYDLPDGVHNVHVEAPGREPEERSVEVRIDHEARLHIPLRRRPRSGQTDLAIFSTLYAGFLVPASVRALCSDCLDAQNGIILAGGGAALGAFTSFFLTDEKMTTGTSYFIMAGPLYGSVEGFGIAASIDAREGNTFWWTLGGGAVGTTIAILAAGPVDSTIGDSLLLHTGAFWGTLSGFMLWGSIGAERESDLGKFLLAGLNVGLVSGIVFSGETEYTWSHVAMINLGTAASTAIFLGIGAATEADAGDSTRRWRFALGGMAVGFIASGLLTRYWDEPRYLKNLTFMPPIPRIEVAADGSRRYLFDLVSGRF
jgi:hypothetical protein